MRRCLLTILPAVKKLSLSKDFCFCHGACYEFGCFGADMQSSKPDDIEYHFPQFQPTGFSEKGQWDYRGANAKETQSECKERCVAIATWLVEEACSIVRERSQLQGEGMPTIIFMSHQTITDLLCRILVDGSCKDWEYGCLNHRLGNAAFTEVFIEADGSARFGTKSSDQHLLFINSPLARRTMIPTQTDHNNLRSLRERRGTTMA